MRLVVVVVRLLCVLLEGRSDNKAHLPLQFDFPNVSVWQNQSGQEGLSGSQN